MMAQNNLRKGGIRGCIFIGYESYVGNLAWYPEKEAQG